jgi:hypothetical protein
MATTVGSVNGAAPADLLAGSLAVGCCAERLLAIAIAASEVRRMTVFMCMRWVKVR